MKKFTRRSYNRKLIVFGVSLLAAFGLISTGFSAWLMSSINNVNDATPPVSVSTITNEVIEVTLDGWNPENNTWGSEYLEKVTVNFDAVANDENGRIKAQNATEDLKLELTGKVTNPSKVGSLTIKVELPASIKNAIDAGYIAIKDVPVSNLTEGTKQVGDATIPVWYYEADLEKVAGDNPNENTFAYTVEFVWGDYFGGVNPSEFYDGAHTATRESGSVIGNKIDDSVMVAEMEEFHRIITNGFTPDSADAPTTYAGTIYITVTAAGQDAGN